MVDKYQRVIPVEATNRSLISVLLNKGACIFLVIPFIEPTGLITYLGKTWEWVWHFMVLFDAIMLLIIFALAIKKIEKIYLLYAAFFLTIAFSTVLNGGEAMAVVYNPARMIAFIILIDYFSKIGRLNDLLSLVKGILGIFILINLWFQFVDQDFFGYTEARNYMNFFQSDNFQGYWYIVFILIVYISNSRKKKSRQIYEMVFWISVCVASLIRAWAATCLAIFLVYVLLLFVSESKIMRLLTPWSGFLVNIIFNILVIVFQIQKYFSFMIVDILHKDLTFSYRTPVWASAIQNILKKPLLGYGTNISGRMSINYNSALSRFNFSHNAFLEITIQGGFIALLLFALLYFEAAKEIRKSNDNSITKSMINLALFCILLMQFTEFSAYEPFINLPVILCFYYKYLNVKATR